jgi:hypothetical protein
MISYWLGSHQIKDDVYIPKYYNPQLLAVSEKLQGNYTCVTIRELVDKEVLRCDTGDEIGKMAYGTGDIPFVRTSDIANWEIKSSPKQGVSREIYAEYATKQDVQAGDILFVRDGTYLIGVNSFITDIDKELLYQSHILKIRVNVPDVIHPVILFLAFNCDFVQQQIRSFQFCADIIDTIGNRFYDIEIPIPKNKIFVKALIESTEKALLSRVSGKAFIKQCPKLIEESLLSGSAKPLEAFAALDNETLIETLTHETVTAEFGPFTSFWQNSKEIVDGIYLPKYYDVTIKDELYKLRDTCKLTSILELQETGFLEYNTGDEIGKMAYGTGTIPFIRTSDFSNWEIKHNPKQGVSQAIWEKYQEKEDVRKLDVLLVRDGTYLVGSSCLITKEDEKCLFCGGLFKFRMLRPDYLDPFLFLGLMNAYIVKRQMRTKQFTRDVIDTLGNRIEEVVLPIPKSPELRKAISDDIKTMAELRINARTVIKANVLSYAKI